MYIPYYKIFAVLYAIITPTAIIVSNNILTTVHIVVARDMINKCKNRYIVVHTGRYFYAVKL